MERDDLLTIAEAMLEQREQRRERSPSLFDYPISRN